MTAYPAQPEFATNRPDDGESVAGALCGLLGARIAQGQHPPLAIASAYFNVDGFGLLADELEQVGPVRLLLGAEPDDHVQHLTVTPLKALDAPSGDPLRDEAVKHHEQALKQDRDLLGFTLEADAAARRLVAWLRAHGVEVRRLTSVFLHGKAFLVEDPVSVAVLAGSSNFTYAGLARNRELNLGSYQPGVVTHARGWFEEQWDEAEPYDLAALYESRFEAHSPEHVFLRMLYELYGEVGRQDQSVSNELGLTAFARDGVWRAKRILERRGGVIVADEVGLGKTYLAGELIYQAAIVNRQKVLLVGPATVLRSTWQKFLKKFNLPATPVSFDKLVADLDTAGSSGSSLDDPDSYALVVVDEAHGLRNPRTRRADAMRRLLGGAVPKQVVFLTATPVNNSLLDVKTLISYITNADAAFADIDVPSLKDYFDRAMNMDPDELSPHHLFDVLNEIAVRRTRSFIKRYYPNERIDGELIRFPTPAAPKVGYDLDKVFPHFFDRFAEALGADVPDEEFDEGVVLTEPGRTLTMARYVPSHFVLGTEQAAQYQVQNAGLLRSGLLKRFESSAVAFGNTLDKMRRSHEHFLRALDGGYVLTGDALRAWVNSAGDDVEELVGSLDADQGANIEPAGGYDVARLRNAVESDLALLTELRDAVGDLPWDKDPKVKALIKELRTIAAEARQEGIGDQDTRDKRKVLVFTYFADTAQYLKDALDDAVLTDRGLAEYRGRLVLATGADQEGKQDAIVGFAPRTAGREGDEDLYDLCVATDVLSEGVNLQQARHIINYDLPWNPMRLVQRHGRIDRIGSKHDKIFLRCFFPDQRLEALLGLQDRLERKLKQATAAFGAPGVLPGMAGVDRVLSETREEIERLRRGDASLFEDGSGLGAAASASAEEFQRRLAKAFESDVTKKAVLGLPWGAGAGLRRKGGEAGIVFCARVADHKRPSFRFVPLDAQTLDVRRSDDGEPLVVTELLTSLLQADPGHDARDSTPPESADIPAGLRKAAFAAWTAAQQSIYEEWTLRTDPANIEPSVPRTMLDAAELVRRHGGVLGDAQDPLVERLNQEVDRSIQRQIREILRCDDTEADKAQRLKQAADTYRLARPEIPLPNPPIELDDIRLICWTAVHP